jgi:hypothetical protein
LANAPPWRPRAQGLNCGTRLFFGGLLLAVRAVVGGFLWLLTAAIGWLLGL